MIAQRRIPIERLTGCLSDWGMLNNDWPIQKFDLLTLIWGSLCYSQILNPCIPDLYKGYLTPISPIFFFNESGSDHKW